MSTTKEQFMKQKLANFVIFIEKEFGRENNIYKDLVSYQNNFENFLRILIHLQKYAQIIENELHFEEKVIVDFLESRGMKKKVLSGKKNCGEILNKIDQYFSMFISVLNS